MKTLGSERIYQGTEFPWLRGLRVQVVGVFKGAALSGYDPDAPGRMLRDEDAIMRHGGIEDGDRVEVRPWMPKDGRWSFATSNPRAGDLVAMPPSGK